MNLDGETNLKIKAALDATRTLDKVTLLDLRAHISCEAPNARLYNFTGNLEVESGGNMKANSGPIPVSPNEVLLRGCSLRNTEYIYGAVIYAGGRVCGCRCGCVFNGSVAGCEAVTLVVPRSGEA